MSLRVLVADDHESVRRGVRALFEIDPSLEVVDEAADGREAIQKAIELQPDVVLLDITMPDMNGLEAARKIRERVPQAEILAFSQHDSQQMINEALKAGARGYVLKSDAARDLVAAVKAVSQRKPFLSSTITKYPFPESF